MCTACKSAQLNQNQYKTWVTQAVQEADKASKVLGTHGVSPKAWHQHCGETGLVSSEFTKILKNNSHDADPQCKYFKQFNNDYLTREDNYTA